MKSLNLDYTELAEKVNRLEEWDSLTQEEKDWIDYLNPDVGDFIAALESPDIELIDGMIQEAQRQNQEEMEHEDFINSTRHAF